MSFDLSHGRHTRAIGDTWKASYGRQKIKRTKRVSDTQRRDTRNFQTRRKKKTKIEDIVESIINYD